jgi:hypothetical protein
MFEIILVILVVYIIHKYIGIILYLIENIIIPFVMINMLSLLITSQIIIILESNNINTRDIIIDINIIIGNLTTFFNNILLSSMILIYIYNKTKHNMMLSFFSISIYLSCVIFLIAKNSSIRMDNLHHINQIIDYHINNWKLLINDMLCASRKNQIIRFIIKNCDNYFGTNYLNHMNYSYYSQCRNNEYSSHVSKYHNDFIDHKMNIYLQYVE